MPGMQLSPPKENLFINFGKSPFMGWLKTCFTNVHPLVQSALRLTEVHTLILDHLCNSTTIVRLLDLNTK